MVDGSGIKRRIAVYSSCVNRVGKVEGVAGGSIRPAGGGQPSAASKW
jgi:hypothetical protein